MCRGLKIILASIHLNELNELNVRKMLNLEMINCIWLHTSQMAWLPWSLKDTFNGIFDYDELFFPSTNRKDQIVYDGIKNLCGVK